MQWPPTRPGRNGRKFHLVPAAISTSSVSMPRRLKISASSLISAMLTSRCVFSMTLAASATLIEEALCVPAVMIAAVQLVDELRGFGRRARGDLADGRQAMLLVARVDALGAVAGEEILVELQARDALEDRHAHLFGAARDTRWIRTPPRRPSSAPCRRFRSRASSGVRSGRLYSSMGVGTVTMNTRQRFRSARLVVNVSRFASLAARLLLVSSVLSRPALSSAMRAASRRSRRCRSACRTPRPAAARHSPGRRRRRGTCADSA